MTINWDTLVHLHRRIMVLITIIFGRYALDKAFDLKPGLTRIELLNMIDGYILVQARLVEIYES